MPNAAIGANYSPTEFMTDTRDGQSYCNAYLGNTFQWLRNFKEGGSTLPWSEDCEPHGASAPNHILERWI